MNRRQKIWTTASLAVTAGAILGGVAVTSNAMAASGTASTDAPVTLEMISLGDGTGGEAIHCTFTDVPIEFGALPDLPLPDGAIAGGSGVVVSGVVAATDVPADAVLAPAGSGPDLVGTVTAIAGTLGTPGQAPTLVEPANVRAGTGDECAALRPVAVPAPPAG